MRHRRRQVFGLPQLNVTGLNEQTRLETRFGTCFWWTQDEVRVIWPKELDEGEKTKEPVPGWKDVEGI